MKKVFLEDVATALEETMDGWEQFLNTETGEIVSLPSCDNDYIDREEEDEKLAEEIDSSDAYIRLSNQYDINEYKIMESFADERGDSRLFRALNGRKPFRHFKDAINDLAIAEEYYSFRYRAFCGIAAEWCRDNGIPYKCRATQKT